MKIKQLQDGVVHKLPADLKKAILNDQTATDLWETKITPLGRNEFICWVESAKQLGTRDRRVRRSIEEILEGKRRPCCWMGCSHRGVGTWSEKALANKK